jgi:GNAT superfamily N-acetyltransferase
MRVTVHTLVERPELARHDRRLHFSGAWPRFLEDTELNPLFDEVVRGRDFADFQLGLWDERGRVVAVGDTVPFRWDGTAADLPHRISEVVARGIADRRRGRAPNAMSALAAVVDPRLRGKGLSTRVVQEMSRIAARHGLRALVAPVRPTWKGRYPLVPMDHYVRWRAPGGGPFDPWLRVHWRLGARVVRIARRAMVVEASLAQWEEWTGLAFPTSGPYVVPGAFNPVRIDRTRNRGLYVEPNVWMRHPVRPRARGAGR